MLVSTAWLSDHLKDANLVILAIGQKSDYDAAHIPGSRFLNYSDIILAKSPEGLRVELPPMDHLAGVFAALGATNDSRIILYPLKDWTPQVGRAWLTLDAMGLGAHAAILNGGLPLWRNEDRAVTAEVPPPARGRIEPCPQSDVIAKLQEVRDAVGRSGVELVDGRAPEVFAGTQSSDGKRPGHIPGATSLPFPSLQDEKGRLLPVATLQSKFSEAGIQSGQRVISYCGTGQVASNVYFVARYLGYDARMYDGSWDEWSDHADLPAETGPHHR